MNNNNKRKGGGGDDDDDNNNNNKRKYSGGGGGGDDIGTMEREWLAVFEEQRKIVEKLKKEKNERVAVAAAATTLAEAAVGAAAAAVAVCDGLEGVEDELVLKDEISGSDESDSASIQILDHDNVGKDATGRVRRKAQKVPSTKLRANTKGNVPPLDELASADDDSFVVDTEAVEDEANNSAYQQDQEGTTSSNFNFSQVISHHTPVPKDPRRSGGGGSTKRNSTSGKACFNCGAIGHELFKCPEPRDTRRISQNRNSFSKRRESAGSRFHEQCQGPQPGVISDQLRDALGIGLRVLPPWIYRMRQLGLLNGYPPAYRKRATEQLTVKFHMEDETTSAVGGRRKRKHAETTGENDQCRVKPEKLIRYSGFNYEADDYVDFDAQQWLIPPWDTFVQAQQHYIDQHLASVNVATDGTVKENATDDNNGKKRHKTVADVDVGRIEKLDAEDGEQLEEEGEEETDDEAVDEPGEDVLFVDASRTLAKKKKKGNATLEEGEIVDESEAETDLDLRKLNSNKIDDNVTVRKSKKTTTKKLRKKRKTATVPSAPSDDVPPPSPPEQKQKVPDAMAPPNAAEGGGVQGGGVGPSTSKNDGKDHHEQLGEQQQQQEPMVVLEMQLGTHVPLNRLSVAKPPLENWAIGIQAFQHQPPSTSSGFFKRMHQIVKSVRKSGGD
uniref:CCHC-type domain-containing protein n=1 Tax=Globodera rostochiensis TaxID=31243 RepID=A0A914HIK7_GLORO